MTTRAEYDRRRRQAKREAGWREVAFHVPEYVKGRVGQIASTYRLSRETVMQAALERGLALIGKQEWYQRARAVPFRLKRRDAGVCAVCRARLRR
jgi:predicted transcriptional regulator